MPKPVRSLMGQRFGRLLVLEFSGLNKWNKALWLCLCDCGITKVLLGNSLTAGRTQSCGCFRKETAPLNVPIKHGWHGTVEYNAFLHARSRCLNPMNPSYSNYGGRGIQFLFSSFDEWITTLGPRPSSGHSVNRIDNDGHYEPGNVEWATVAEQSDNRRTNRYLVIDGQSKTFAQWSEHFGWAYRGTTPSERLKRGWCLECSFKLLSGPCQHKSRDVAVI
jgi:hypothetical protein